MRTIDLPTAPRVRDVEAWRARIEERRQELHRHKAINHAAVLAEHRPQRAEKPKPKKARTPTKPREPRTPRTPRPAALRPCITCGHMTRSNHLKAADYPGTRPRARAGECSSCAERIGRPRTGKRTPHVTDTEAAAWVAAYVAGTSAADIARETGRNPVTVREHLRRAGVVIVPANQTGRAS